ncbi:MAG: PilZ domain-containing protein [Bdellovibrionaceae bacterium]|nr:PilZ domain-containing protein [Pseudobdellovibrionaceae bacterium]
MEQFRKLNATEKKGILQELHHRRAGVVFKFPDSGVLRMKAEGRGWGDSILGSRPATLGDSRKDQMVTGNFQMDGEFYFFTAKVRIQKRLVHLEISEPIHRLIRRKNSRIKVPASLAMNISTKRVGDRISFLRGPLQDISLRGCRVAFHGAEGIPKKDEIVAGLLRFGSRQALEFSAVVRYSRRMARSHYDHIVGLEFLTVSDANRYQAWLVDVHREIYSLK